VLSDLRLFGATNELSFAERAIGSHDMQNEDFLAVMIENPARRLDSLAAA
jgi:hypothetical protein